MSYYKNEQWLKNTNVKNYIIKKQKKKTLKITMHNVLGKIQNISDETLNS